MNKKEMRKKLLKVRKDLNEVIGGLKPDEPPPPPPEESIPYFHLDALGIFLDVLAHAWKVKREDETFDRIEAVIAEAAQYGCSACSYFSFLHSGQKAHKHLNWKTPWEVKTILLKKKFDFDSPNERYWDLRERFAELLAKYQMEDIPQAWMWGKYSFPVFDEKNNINGIDGVFDSKARSYLLQHGRRLAYQSKQVYGITQWLKPMNEARHSGSDEKGHWIADFHKDMYHAVKDCVNLKNFVCDASLSEFAFCQLIEHSQAHRNCSKCGRPWDNPPGSNRILTQEKHGVSIKDDLYGDVEYVLLDGFLISAWHHWKVSEDGSRNPKAELQPIPGSVIRVASPQQLREMLFDCWTRCRDHPNRKKETIFGLVPFETYIVQSWGLEEYYDINVINWDRFKAVQETYKEIYG